MNKRKEKEEKELFVYYKDEELQGIGFIATRLGYGFNKAADISLFICVGPDLETVKGIEVLDHAETPGLGGRMTEENIQETICRKKAEAEVVNRKRKKRQ